MKRAVVLILDGLRRDFVNPDMMPHLHAFRAAATWCDAHRSVLPSVTRCVSACFATGCLPARHGLQANTMVLQEPSGPELEGVKGSDRVIQTSGPASVHHALAGSDRVIQTSGPASGHHALVLRDAGAPDFLSRRRAVTGRSLDVPTMAERLAGHGGSVIMGNVSPGATYTQDPDGFGYLHHRTGSYGPGRVPLTDGWAAVRSWAIPARLLGDAP